MDTWPEAAEFGFQREPAGLSGITLQMNDGGILENVHVHDIEMISGVGSPIDVRISERTRRVLPGVSTLRNVTIENVRGRTLFRPASSVIGSRTLRPQNIVFRNIDLEVEGGGDLPAAVPEFEPGGEVRGLFHSIFPAYGFYLRHADGVRFENVTIRPRNATARSLVVEEDCTRVDASGLKEIRKERKKKIRRQIADALEQ